GPACSLRISPERLVDEVYGKRRFTAFDGGVLTRLADNEATSGILEIAHHFGHLSRRCTQGLDPYARDNLLSRASNLVNLYTHDPGLLWDILFEVTDHPVPGKHLFVDQLPS